MGNKTKGILCIIMAAFCFALMNTFVRLAGDLPSIQKSFFRNLVAFIFSFFILLRQGKAGFAFKRENFKYLLLRSTFGIIGILGNFYAVDHLLLSDASMLNKLSPFFAIICSYFCLKEKVTPIQILGIIAAFIGALFIIRPSGSALSADPAALVGMIGALGAGAAYTMVRLLSKRGERGPFIVFFFSAFSCLVTLPYLLFAYHTMEWWQFGVLMLAGLAACGGQFSVTAAYSYAPAGEISVFDYTQVIFAALLGFMFFRQLPDGYSIIGYIIICGVSVLMFIYNRKRAGLSV